MQPPDYSNGALLPRTPVTSRMVILGQALRLHVIGSWRRCSGQRTRTEVKEAVGLVEREMNRPAYWEIDPVRRELRHQGRPVHVGGRAYDIIEFLVRSNTEIVAKDALMAHVWPGAIVEENTLQAHMSAIRKALGADRQLLQTVFGRGYRLLGQWVVRTDASSIGVEQRALTVTKQVVPIRLPLPASELIGRNEAVQQLANLSSAHRILTLTGPGGIGKTRLALEVARHLAGNFDDGAGFVDLAPLSVPDLVPSALATALSLPIGTGEVSPASVARAIGSRSILIVLDNCEHLIGAVATLAETLMQTCPRISILATSREWLRTDGEYVYRVQPLALPPDGEDEGSLLKHGAVQLFIARARASGLDASLRETDLRAACAICRRLDGIPLAIEFAAAHTALLGMERVLARLEDRFALLVGARRTALPRHRTLRATLDWSYELLPACEQLLLRRLAVFAGGFTLEAASAVMRATGMKENAVADGIMSLISKSLVSAAGPVTAGRWSLLETIRAYALEKLAASGEIDRAARWHAEFFRDLIVFAEAPSLRAKNLETYAAEIGNVRAAIDWAFSDIGDPDIGAALTAAYVPVWLHLSLLVECRECVKRAIDKLGHEAARDSQLGMRLHIALGLALTRTTAESEAAETAFSQGLEVADSLSDAENQIRALWGLWTLRCKHADHRAGLRFAEQLEQIALRSSNLEEIGFGYRAIATTMHYLGYQAAARDYLERMRHLPSTHMREDQAIWFLYDMRVQEQAMRARVLVLQGSLEQAVQNAADSFEQARRLGHNLSMCFTLRYATCAIALTLRDLPTARAAINTLIEISTTNSLGSWLGQARCLEGMLLISQREFERGTTTLRAAIDANRSGGFLLCYPEMLCFLAEGLAGLGQQHEACRTIHSAIQWSNLSGECWYLPELFRLQGDLALQISSADCVEAEACYARAMEAARGQGAALWELRAANSFARLRLDQNRAEEARDLLAPVYGRFSEGFNTKDLQAAGELLAACNSQQVDTSKTPGSDAG